MTNHVRHASLFGSRTTLKSPISQKLSSKWWDENGEFGLMNPVQLEFVRQKLLEAAYDDGTIRPVHIIHSVDCKYLMSVAEVSCLG